VGFNPFYNFDREQCVTAIQDIQDRLLNGAASVSHAGSGSVQYVNPETDKSHLQHLANRLADIDGITRPAPARVKAWVVEHVGYR
jgi:hypothetical protein